MEPVCPVVNEVLSWEWRDINATLRYKTCRVGKYKETGNHGREYAFPTLEFALPGLVKGSLDISADYYPNASNNAPIYFYANFCLKGFSKYWAIDATAFKIIMMHQDSDPQHTHKLTSFNKHGYTYIRGGICGFSITSVVLIRIVLENPGETGLFIKGAAMDPLAVTSLRRDNTPMRWSKLTRKSPHSGLIGDFIVLNAKYTDGSIVEVAVYRVHRTVMKTSRVTKALQKQSFPLHMNIPIDVLASNSFEDYLDVMYGMVPPMNNHTEIVNLLLMIDWMGSAAALKCNVICEKLNALISTDNCHEIYNVLRHKFNDIAQPQLKLCRTQMAKLLKTAPDMEMWDMLNDNVVHRGQKCALINTEEEEEDDVKKNIRIPNDIEIPFISKMIGTAELEKKDDIMTLMMGANGRISCEELWQNNQIHHEIIIKGKESGISDEEIIQNIKNLYTNDHDVKDSDKN